MNKKGLFGLVSVAAVVTAALLVVAVLAGGSNGATPAPAPAQVGGEVQTAALASPAGGPTEGIKVHGSWTLEVRNPDGTLVSRQEFENALSTGAEGGTAALQKFLARTNTVGSWIIELNNSGGGPCLASGNPAVCSIVEPSITLTDSRAFKNLTISSPASGADANKVVLSGTATAGRDSNIESVRTTIGYCAPSVAPATGCDDVSIRFGFTMTTLASPVPVVTGQQVLVTVTLSFS